MNAEHLYGFIARALFTESELDRQGRLKRRHSESLDAVLRNSLPFNSLDPSLVSAAIRMGTLYAAIAAFENAVRNFVEKTLHEKCGDNWWTEKVQEKIRTRAEQRKEGEDKKRWHTPRGDRLLNYTDFKDLSAIIVCNWEIFEPHVGDQEWVKHVFDSLELSRNVIMHSGQLEERDIERVAQSMRDWIAQVGA